MLPAVASVSWWCNQQSSNSLSCSYGAHLWLAGMGLDWIVRNSQVQAVKIYLKGIEVWSCNGKPSHIVSQVRGMAVNSKPEPLLFLGALLCCSFPLSKNNLCESSDEFSYLKLRGDGFGVMSILAINQSCKRLPAFKASVPPLIPKILKTSF